MKDTDSCYNCRHHFTCLHNKVYFLALRRDYVNPKNVYLDSSRCLDGLSCETWKYLGPRVVTKVQMKRQRDDWLAWVNTEARKEMGESFEGFTKLTIS